MAPVVFEIRMMSPDTVPTHPPATELMLNPKVRVEPAGPDWVVAVVGAKPQDGIDWACAAPVNANVAEHNNNIQTEKRASARTTGNQKPWPL